MSSSPSPRSLSARIIVLATVLVVAAAACAGSGAVPDPSAPGGSPTPGGTPSAAPSNGPVIDIPGLVGAGTDHDGALVTVRGFFLADGTTARFCDAVLESYPPQCGGTVLALDGTVPPAILEQLERPDDPALADVAWGQVEIRGTYRAAGPDGLPRLEILEMRVVD